MIFGISVIVIFGFWLKKLTKKYEDLTIGEILSMVIVHESETVFMFVTIFINLSEAILAASITPTGETPPNPLSRFLSHTLISSGAIAAGIALFRTVSGIFKPDMSAGQRVVKAVLALTLTIAALGIPYLNMRIIANGLHESLQLQLFVISINPFISTDTLIKTYIYYHLPATYDPWDGMSYVMCTTVSLTGVHLLMVLIEGLHVLDSSNVTRTKIVFGDRKKESVNKKEAKKENKEENDYEEKGEKRHNAKIETNIELCLKFLNYSGDKLNNIKNTALGKLTQIDNTRTRAQLASRLANIVTEIATIKSIGSADEKKKRKEKIEHNIIELFKGNPRETDGNKVGFGIDVKKN